MDAAAATPDTGPSYATLARRFRLMLVLFIVGLVLSGLTAFPLQLEMELLARLVGVEPGADLATLHGLQYWVGYVRDGLTVSYAAYPFLGYGTDWLAFGHLAIAVFFVGPYLKPTEYDWTLIAGIIACVAIVPTAMICGQVRGIPIPWRLMDCSFGLGGLIPLLYCRAVARRLRTMQSANVTG